MKEPQSLPYCYIPYLLQSLILEVWNLPGRDPRNPEEVSVSHFCHLWINRQLTKDRRPRVVWLLCIFHLNTLQHQLFVFCKIRSWYLQVNFQTASKSLYSWFQSCMHSTRKVIYVVFISGVQRLSVKTSQRLDHPRSFIFSVMIYCFFI